jgi:pilus assembly protein CpaE
MGLKMLKEHKPDLVILDVQMPEMDGYEVCRRLRQIHGLSHIPVIMVTALSTINSMQAGFEAGADDYITKPFKPAELQMRVNAILRRAATGGSATLEPETSTIAVFSLRGGTGCTSFAVNLAIGLSRLWGTNGILLDLDLPLGSCEILMDLQPKQSLSTLIQHDISSLDEVLIGGHLTKHYSGTQLFAGIFNPADSDFITENIVSLVLDHLQSLSRYVIVDTAHNFSAQTLAVLDAADRILLPITPDIISVRKTASVLKVFDSLGYPRDKIEVIVNWVFPQSGLDKPAIEKYINHPVLMVIPHVPALWSEAINMGQPVIFGDSSTPLVTLLEDLTWHFSTESDQNSKRDDRTDMWKRVAKRRWKRRADQNEKKRKQRA